MRGLAFRVVGFGVSLLLTGFAAGAATISVTTTADEFGTNAGECSLREAVQAANTNAAFGGCKAGSPGKDSVRLPSGRFLLTLGGSGDDTNAEGDLDIIEDLVIMGGKAPASKKLEDGLKTPDRIEPESVIESAIGAPDVLGDGDRVLHVDPGGASGTVNITLMKVAVVGGDLSCDGIDCIAGGAGIDQEGNGDLVLSRVLVARNTVSCTGVDCGADPGDNADAGAIRGIGDGTLRLDRTTLIDNRAECRALDCGAGHGAIFWGQDNLNDNDAPLIQWDNVRIENNTSFCGGDRCDSNEPIEMTAAEIRVNRAFIGRNRSECREANPLVPPANDDDHCNSQEILASDADDEDLWRQVQFAYNVCACEGYDCDSTEILDLGGGGDSTIDGMTIIGNTLECTGDECGTDEVFDSFGLGPGGIMRFRNVSFLNNLQTCSGYKCDTDEVIDGSFGGDINEWQNVVVKGNRQICHGEECDLDEIIDSAVGGGKVSSVKNLVVTDNQQLCIGNGCVFQEFIDTWSGDDVTIDRVRVTNNQAICRGDGCILDEMMDSIVGSQRLDIRDFVLADNTRRCEGDNCVRFRGVWEVIRSPDLSVRGIVVAGNRVECRGSGCAPLEGPGQILAFESATGEVSKLVVIDNVIECIGSDCTGTDIAGVRIDDSDLEISKATIENNRIDGSGAGIANGGAEGPGTLVLIKSKVRGNIAGTDGGGIFNPAGADLTLRKVDVVSNSADGQGGGIFNEGTLSISGGKIEDNDPDDCVNSGGGTGC